MNGPAAVVFANHTPFEWSCAVAAFAFGYVGWSGFPPWGLAVLGLGHVICALRVIESRNVSGRRWQGSDSPGVQFADFAVAATLSPFSTFFVVFFCRL